MFATIALRRWAVLEEDEPKPGWKVDRCEPGYDERDAGHLINSLHIFARGAGREADRNNQVVVMSVPGVIGNAVDL